jgi:hypothetical protein
MYSLEDDEGNCIEEGDLKRHIINYYKCLLGNKGTTYSETY